MTWHGEHWTCDACGHPFTHRPLTRTEAEPLAAELEALADNKGWQITVEAISHFCSPTCLEQYRPING
jgi:hypothetical protein